MMSKFPFPFGMADLHYIKSQFPIEPQGDAVILHISEDRNCAVYTGNNVDTYSLREGDRWFGLAAFTFCVKNRTYFRDYFIHDIRLSMHPLGVYTSAYQSCTDQLKPADERGKTKVALAQIRTLFECNLIEEVLQPLLQRSDTVEILGSWQQQEKLFELGFKPVANAYRWGEFYDA